MQKVSHQLAKKAEAIFVYNINKSLMAKFFSQAERENGILNWIRKNSNKSVQSDAFKIEVQTDLEILLLYSHT